MEIQVLDDEAAVAREAAAFIAAQAREAVAARGLFTLAVSGGRTPWLMLRELAGLDVPWAALQLFQVDERIAPAGDPDRNFTHLQETLLAHAPLPAAQVHPMPVEDPDPVAAARTYAATIAAVTGAPAVFDLVHLGLGPDGHTASLVPGDPVLDVRDADVAITGGEYQGRRRMTLTYPIIDRARHILWVITGAEKAPRVVQMWESDDAIPAGRVRDDRATALIDAAAAAGLTAFDG